MTKRKYIPPTVKAVAFTVEHGYEDSNSHQLGLTEGEGDIYLEERQTAANNWGNDWNI